MLPLSNDTWDIQFQEDGHYPELNFGWFFARANNLTVELFQRCFALWKLDTKRWDQKVLEEIAGQMEFYEQSLRINRLPESYYKNFMKEPFEYTLFGAEDAVQVFVNQSTMIHFTCIETELKEYFGRNFGGFGDLQQYYSNPPPLLGATNIFGLVDSIHVQVVLAAQLASSTHRTFIWPDTVNMVQKRFFEDANRTDFYHRPRFPGIRAVSYASAKRAGVDVVEGRYLSNQRRYTDEKILLEQVVFHVGQYVFDGGIPALDQRISKLLPNQVAILDFADFGPSFLERYDHEANDPHGLDTHYTADAVESAEARWFRLNFEAPGIKDYVIALSSRINNCQKANVEGFCLRLCD